MQIRPLQDSDISQTARLYIDRLENSTFARLGELFVRGILRAVAASPYGRILVAVDDDYIHGFIAAATNVKELFAWIRRRRGVQMFLRAFPKLIFKPWLWWSMLTTPDYFRRVGEEEIAAELLYIAVDWEAAETDLGTRLLAAMLHELRGSGVRQVKVTCEADNEPPQRLLRSFSFEKRSEFYFYDKLMLVYVNDNLTGK